MNHKKLGKIAGLTALAVSLSTLPMISVYAEQDEIEEVVVTGSYIKKKNQADSVSPLTNIDQESIDAQGIETTQELIRWLPSNTGSENQTNALTQGGTPGTANVNLRGLGLGSTLVLINGRRQTVSSAVANGGDTFVDINSMIPMIMIQNVEVLKDGAAALYGSDAVAGVANFKTRDSFEGFEVRGSYQSTTESDDHSDTQLGALFGVSSDNGSIVIGMNQLKRTEMQLGERDFPTKTESSFGQPGSFLPLGLSPTLPATVPGVFNADPACGTLTGSRIVPTGGGSSLCFFDFGPSFTLVPKEDRFSVYTVAEYDLSPDLTLRVEAGTARNDVSGGYSPSYPVLSFPRIAASHPGNPYGVGVVSRFRAIGDGTGAAGSSRVVNYAQHDTDRLVINLTGAIADTGWDFDASFTDSRNTLELSANDQVGKQLTLALAGLGGTNCNPFTGTPGVGTCLYYNPFGNAATASPGDATFNTPEVLAFISDRNVSNTDTELKTIDLIATGVLLELPAGEMGAAVGYQRREESRATVGSLAANNSDLLFLIGDVDNSASREVDAFFFELAAPLMDNNTGTLELQLAVRYEDYSTGFDSTDPKIGFLFTNADQNLSGRFTYGTSFRAPTLFQQTEQATSLNATDDPLTDSIVFLGETAAPNANLAPEEADTYNIGVTWSPMDDLTLSVDYYNVEYTDRLSQEAGQQLIVAEAAALTAAGCGPTQLALPQCAAATNPQVIRDPGTGTPLRIFSNRFNATSSETDGFDFEASYFWESKYGSFSVLNNTTFISSYDLKACDTCPTVDGAGKRNENTALARSLPEIRSNTALGWIRDNHSINLMVRYIDEYKDDAETVDSWWVTDFQYNYDANIFDNGAQFTVGALNMLDEEPPTVSGATNEFGYDTKVHDPRGRMIYARFKYSL